MSDLDPSTGPRAIEARPVTPRTRGARATALVGVGLWAAVGCDAGDPRMSQGQALFQANCATCHGPDARGDGPMASSLPVQPPSILQHLGHHTQAQLVQLITGGIPPAMPPQPLSPEQVQLVVDYVWTLVPESDVAALRAMQQQMEMMGDSAMANMPGTPGMPGMGMDANTTMPGMEHSGH